MATSLIKIIRSAVHNIPLKTFLNLHLRNVLWFGMLRGVMDGCGKHENEPVRSA